MSNNIKTCRYKKCPYGKKIDIDKEEYRLIGKSMYYHKDCYKNKQKDNEKDEQTKSDFQYIKNQWLLNIDHNLTYSNLFKCLNELISQGISSQYLVFTMDYVVKHKLNLKYPNGFKYYVNKDEIKNAYKKQQILNSGVKKVNEFVAIDKFDTPKFSVKSEPKGFGNIFKNKI